MKCTHCQTEIDAKLKFAISSNICPFCGEKIFPDELNELLNDAKIIFESVTDLFKENFEDWLLANYSYINLNTLNSKIEQKDKSYIDKIKKASKELLPIVVAGSGGTISQEINNPVAEIIKKNAGIKTDKEKLQKLKAFANQIKSGATESEVIEVEEEEDNENSDEDVTHRPNFKSSSEERLNLVSVEDAENLDTSNVFAVLNKSGKGNMKDMIRLQQQFNKIGSGRDSIDTGEKKKNSFSRAV
ncbi:MAG: hypothetical protein LC122_12790 [Chitinophagales bacterium]|nr:hypothetical protein [Chitinophagales bacterium]